MKLLSLFVSALICLATNAQMNPEVSFVQPAQRINNNLAAHGTGLADLNGDESLDVLVANQKSSNSKEHRVYRGHDSAFWEVMRKADRLGDRKQAIEILETAHRQFPHREFEINWMLAMTYAQLGQYEKTIEIWEAGHKQALFFGLSELNWKELDWLKPLQKLPQFKSVFDRDKELREHAEKTATMRYEMVTPRNYSPARKYPLFIVLHGGGDSIDRARWYWRSSVLGREYLAAYIQSSTPLSSKTYGWDGYQEMRAQLRKLYDEIVSKYPVDTSRVLIGGMSAGGMVSLDAVFHNVLPVTGFVVNCPVVPSDFEPSMADLIHQRGVRGVIITGEKDFALSRQKEMVEAFKKAGVEHHFTIITGMGHDVPDDFPRRLDAALNEVIGSSVLSAPKASLNADASSRPKASFQGLGDFPGGAFESLAQRISANGLVVIGYGTTALGKQAFRWTEGEGMVSLGNLPDGSFKSSWASAISADGSVIVGYGDPDGSGDWTRHRGYRWNRREGMVELDGPSGPTREAWGVSADGSVIVGDGGSQAFRWTQSGGAVALGTLPGSKNSRAIAVSADGSVIVGSSYDLPSWEKEEAYVWTQTGGMQGLGYLVGGNTSFPNAISSDGSVIAGTSFPSSGNTAFRWSRSGGMVAIGSLSGTKITHPGGVSADGSIIVGLSSVDREHSTAFIWDATRGIRSLQNVLETDYGLQLPGWNLQYASGITPDGSVIVGWGTNPAGQQEAFRVVLSEASRSATAIPSRVPTPRGPYLGQKPPGNMPEVFAKGIVSIEDKNTHAVQFSPDGKLLVFSRYPDGTSYKMAQSDNGWSAPEPTSFRGKEVSFDAASKRLFYYDQAGDLLFVRYGPDGFSKPTKLPPTINTKETEYYPSVTAKGNLFFSRSGRWNEARIQVAKLEGDGFGQPVDLGEPINIGGASHAFVAPDESYILFNSPRPGSHTENDIWVSFHKQDASWTPPINLGKDINRDAKAVLCPTVSPDGKYIFFTRLQQNLTGNVYWVSAEILAPLREAALSNKAASKLEITYIANDGFLISGGSQKILIDSLVAPHTMEYNVPSSELMSQMQAGTAPFDGINTVLVTHPHADHFSAQLAATYLARNANAVFASTTGAVNAVRKIDPGLEKRTLIVSPGQIRTSRVEKVGGIEIEALWVDHGVQGYDASKFENLAYRFRLNGVSVLHTGDATKWADFRLFDWGSGVDVVFASVWADNVDMKLEILKNVIKARNVVLMHYVLPKDLDEMQKVAEKLRPHFERVIVFQAPMEKKIVSAKTASAFTAPSNGLYFGQKPPEDTPEVFAPGFISTEDHAHSSPAFSPDGKEIYWSMFSGDKQLILFTRLDSDKWTIPKAAPFSGKYSDGGPAFTNDGKRLYFYSERPLPENPNVLKDDLWYVERVGNGWSEPKNVGISNLSGREKWIYSPSVADNGNVYITGQSPSGYGLYVMKMQDGRLLPPELLPKEVNSENDKYIWTPFIAHDENYLLFSAKRKDSHGFNDLYISFRAKNGAWSRPLNLGEKINNVEQLRFPYVSRDGRYLFFTRSNFPNRDDVFWVSAKVIEPLRLQALGTADLIGDYLGQTPPGTTPQIFARGIISTDDKEHGVPSFSPDGNEVYWLEVRPPGPNNSEWLSWGMTMRRENGRWSPPQLSKYKGIPVFSPDGKRMYFAAPRTDQNLAQENQDDIWYIEKQENGWSEPKCLNFVARSPELKFASWPTMTNNGSLYFISHAPGLQMNAGIARAEFINGEYAKSELLPKNINLPSFRNWAPFIAPDESYLLFCSTRTGSLDNYGDIYISRHQGDGSWSDPIRLGGPVNTGYMERFSGLSPDGKYFFFSRWSPEHDEDVYWVDASSVPELGAKNATSANANTPKSGETSISPPTKSIELQGSALGEVTQHDAMMLDYHVPMLLDRLRRSGKSIPDGTTTLLQAAHDAYEKKDYYRSFRLYAKAAGLAHGEATVEAYEVAASFDYSLNRSIVAGNEKIILTLHPLFSVGHPLAHTYKIRTWLETKTGVITGTEQQRIITELKPVSFDFSTEHLDNGIVAVGYVLESEGEKLVEFKNVALIAKDSQDRLSRLKSQLSAIKSKSAADQQPSVLAALDTLGYHARALEAERTRYDGNWQHLAHPLGIYLANENFVAIGRTTFNFPPFVARLRYPEDTALAESLANALVAAQNPLTKQTGEMEQAYRSSADNDLVGYRIFVPAGYDSGRKYPLIVALHSGAGEGTYLDSETFTSGHSDPSQKNLKQLAQENGYIIVCPNGRGDFFSERGKTDVLAVLERVRKIYSIDPNRIFLAGWSLGGSAAWQIAVSHPEIFKGIVAAAGAAEWLNPDNATQAGNLKIFYAAGAKDPSISEQRHTADLAKKLFANSMYVEYPETDHDAVWSKALPDIFTFLGKQK